MSKCATLNFYYKNVDEKLLLYNMQTLCLVKKRSYVREFSIPPCAAVCKFLYSAASMGLMPISHFKCAPNHKCVAKKAVNFTYPRSKNNLDNFQSTIEV